MDFDYYEAKEDAKSDFISEHLEDCETLIDELFDILIELNFDVSNLNSNYYRCRNCGNSWKGHYVKCFKCNSRNIRRILTPQELTFPRELLEGK